MTQDFNYPNEYLTYADLPLETQLKLNEYFSLTGLKVDVTRIWFTKDLSTGNVINLNDVEVRLKVNQLEEIVAEQQQMINYLINQLDN